MHPDYLLDHLTAKQIFEWQVYDNIDPIGGFRQDYSTGLIVSTMVNIANSVHGEKGAKNDYKPSDFIPDYSGELKEKQLAQVASNLKLWAKQHNRKVNKDKQREEKLNKKPPRNEKG